MTLSTKILLAVLGVVIIGAVGFIFYKEHQLSQQQAQITQSIVEFKQLQDGIARSQAQFVTKDDLNAFAKQNSVNLDVIQKNLDSLNATVTGINAVVVNSGGNSGNNVPSTNTTPNTSPHPVPTVNCNGTQVPCPNADPFGYMANEQNLALTEPFGSSQVPVGNVSFSAWQQAPWSFNIFPRTYTVTNVLGTDENGRHYMYNKFVINTNNKSYDVAINNAKFEEQYPSPKFSFWNPRLYLGADSGLNISEIPLKGEFTPNVSLGIMSYGQTKVSPDWSFLQVGVGYGVVSGKAQVEVSPAQYNIGKHIPFMSNTYVGPVLGIGLNGDVSVGAGLRVGL